MITPDNIPPDAQRIEYQSGRRIAVYYIWRRGDAYYWAANGNAGEQTTRADAEREAREWIKNGF